MYFNFTVQQAVCTVCRAMSRVYELSVYEHFTSRKGQILALACEYFNMESLSPLGCLIFRESKFPIEQKFGKLASNVNCRLTLMSMVQISFNSDSSDSLFALTCLATTMSDGLYQLCS